VAYPYGQAPDHQLAASEQRYRQEFGPAPFGLFTIGLSGETRHRYLAVNEAYCALTGYRRDEMAGQDFWRDVHPDELPALRTWFETVQAGQGGGTVSADTRLIRQDGEAVCVRLAGCAVQPASGDRYLSAWVLDLTETEQARAETHSMELELQRSRRLDSLGQLVGGIAHDFNNMLTVIANYASLVREEVSVAEAADSSTRWGPVRWDLEQIEDATDRAKRLIKHMLAFARKEQTQAGPVDVGRLIGDVSGLLGEVLGEHVPVTTAHGAGVWPVEADAGLLEQAVINLALNARDAMPDGGQVTIATANIDTLAPAAASPSTAPEDLANLAELLPGHYVQICVTDTGTGMDAMTAEHAFEPFFTTKAGDQAAGLGLAAVGRIAAQAGGKAWLRSAPGRGTTVTIMLPAAEGAAAGPAPSSTAPAAASAGAVLVVDDEAAIREVAHRVLTSAGYQVTTAADGPAALRLLADPHQAADVLLTDVIMPGMTGQAFADQARDLRPGLTVLFMSGYQQESTTASWPKGSTPVIGKPFSRAALLAHVAQALAAPAEAAQAAQATATAGAEAAAMAPAVTANMAANAEVAASAIADTAAQAADPRRPSPIDW
jgi:PAS domain S-box-containing protein